MTSRGSASGDAATFRLGVNYWPARTAMGWWRDFDSAEVEADFARISDVGFDSVRLFLTWADFQPEPDRVEMEMLGHLVTVADLAQDAGLSVMPTLFTGHMSGVNWIPGWALGGSERDVRFRVVSEDGISSKGIRNWYEQDVLRAQTVMASRAAETLAGHQALWAWDLGNENSNCTIPASRSLGERWLEEMTTAIRRQDGRALVTIGLHMEDLEEDRHIGPGEAAATCDFLTMHGYPIYADWAQDETDEQVLSFLAHMTRWLGDGGDVLFSEFGASTALDVPGHRTRNVIDEQTAAGYTERALSVLHAAGCIGGMIWCYSDYPERIWEKPPLDLAPHERSFGLWRADGSPKPSLDAVREFAGRERVVAPAESEWIDLEPGEFYQNPRGQIERLYRRYRAVPKSR